MKARRKLYVLLFILLCITIMIIAINNIVICSMTSQGADYVYELLKNEYNAQNLDICILDYEYVTGASWKVNRSTNEKFENTYVCINTICNPRDLRINKEYDLDYTAKYVAIVDKNIKKKKVDSEDVCVLKAKKIVITDFYHSNEDIEDIRFSELTLVGKLKSFLALFIPKIRIQL